MRAVGIRELKNRLSEYLRAVRGGERVLVTDRGRVVAELGPPGLAPQDVEYPGLLDLVRRGVARPGAANDASLYPPMPSLGPEGESARLLAEERDET